MSGAPSPRFAYHQVSAVLKPPEKHWPYLYFFHFQLKKMSNDQWQWTVWGVVDDEDWDTDGGTGRNAMDAVLIKICKY